VDARGHAIPKPEATPSADGTLVEPGSDGSTNWMSPSFDPQERRKVGEGETGTCGPIRHCERSTTAPGKSCGTTRLAMAEVPQGY
jgi:glucose dehydrogenase